MNTVKQVLILDDNPSNLKLLALALTSADSTIHLATTGREALTIMETQAIDLALLDVELPDANGLDLASKIRAQYPESVIIVLSARDTHTEFDQACASGVDAYVVKPFSLPDVLNLIRQLETNAQRSASEILILPNRGGFMSYRCSQR
jgi:DNA-binding response OmpR family regulator